MAKLKLPFELEKPSSNEYVTQSSQIGHNGEPLEQSLVALKSNEVVIDLSNGRLTYKNQTFLIIGIDESTTNVAVMGEAVMGEATMGAK